MLPFGMCCTEYGIWSFMGLLVYLDADAEWLQTTMNVVWSNLNSRQQRQGFDLSFFWPFDV